MVKNPIAKAILFCQALLFVAAGAVWSQAIPPAAQPGAVERSLQPRPVPEPTRLPDIKIEEEGVPRLGDGKATFQLKSVVFEENLIFSPQQLRRIIAGYLGQTIEVGKLPEVADAVTSFYKKQGYFLTRAYIPPQTIKDGQVLIKVREGRLGDIIIKGNKRYSRELIRNTLKIIRGEGAVRTADVERGLLLLLDYPGLSVRATFKPGVLPATSDIVLEVAEARPVGVSVDYDNFGSRFISQSRYGASLNFYNLAGRGDALYTHGVTGDYGPDGLFYGRAEYVLPLGYSGTRLGVNYSHIQYKLGKELAVLRARGESDSGGIWLSHPVVRSRNVNWFLQGGFNLNDTDQIINDQEVGKDKIRYAYVGATLQWVDFLEGTNTISLRGNQSFARVLGGMDQGDINTIRLNSEVIFSKLEGDVSRIQRLPAGFAMLLTGTGQWSGNRLPSSEQFHIGGAGTVRGYAQGERSGDSGFAATAEMRIPLLGLRNYRWLGRPLGETMQLAAFYDYGRVWISNAELNGEAPLDNLDLQGAGAGLRFNFAPMTQFKIDWSKWVGGTRPTNEQDKNRGIWTVQLVLSF